MSSRTESAQVEELLKEAPRLPDALASAAQPLRECTSSFTNDGENARNSAGSNVG